MRPTNDLPTHMTEITAIYVLFCRNLWKYFLNLSKINITEIRREKFPAGKLKLVWKLHLDVTHFFNSSLI